MSEARFPIAALAAIGLMLTIGPRLAYAESETGQRSEAEAEKFRSGDRVSCRWKSGTAEYPGTVTTIKEGYLYIEYEDGDTEWISPRLCRKGKAKGGTGRPDTALAKTYRVGAKVACLWMAGKKAYPGTVAEIEGGMLLIRYDDGDKEWIGPRLCRGAAALALGGPTLGAGDRVLCRWKEGPKEYPGTVRELSKGMLFVAYDDGDVEWITPKLCRPEAAAAGTGTADASAASRYASGDRVSCRWRAGETEYPGRVSKVRGGMLFVVYDDTDKEWISPTLCRTGGAKKAGTGAPDAKAASRFRTGDRVRCRWKAGSTEYTGRVDEISDGYLHLSYDDGDTEWISPKLCRRTK